MTTGNLEAMKKIESEKNSVLNEYSERLSAETAARKREIIMLNRRITVLMQENTVLRSSLASSKNSRFDGDINSLLQDQQNLIATLKEECELLANRLREERKASK
ncbi:unnamed protein product [Enterobius vermicularis]|uniref:Uncharacterized protein n=1 Tax=Enterobius vermicularis TaxID=51028 RepID=A0A158Q9Z9_ENTVE|nr:unnamed protein product [Enterobius vermicularis]